MFNKQNKICGKRLGQLRIINRVNLKCNKNYYYNSYWNKFNQVINLLKYFSWKLSLIVWFRQSFTTLIKAILVCFENEIDRFSSFKLLEFNGVTSNRLEYRPERRWFGHANAVVFGKMKLLNSYTFYIRKYELFYEIEIV